MGFFLEDFAFFLIFFYLLRFRRKPSTPSFESICSNHFFDHPNSETLLKSTILAPISASLVDWTISVGQTGIRSLILDSAFEESFTPLTGEDPVMLATRNIPTNCTRRGLLGWGLDWRLRPLTTSINASKVKTCITYDINEKI